MQNERLLKRGQLAELEDEKQAIEAKVRIYVQAMRNTFDDARNLPHMDLEAAAVIVQDMFILQERYKAIWPEVQAIKGALGLL